MKLDKIIAVRTAKTLYRDGNLAIKVFNEDFSKSDVLNEALNQSRVENTLLNVPQIHEVAKIDGKWAIVSDYIDGKTLTRLIEEEPSKKSALIAQMADIQLEINRQKVAKLNKHSEKMREKIDACGLNATVRYELLTRLRSLRNDEVLCHGDLTLSNIIIDNDGKPFIIDWSHATQGSAAADTARAYLRFRLAGYIDEADEYLDIYCEKANTPKQVIHKWFPIVAATQLAKGLETEYEFLSEWANVVEYE
ncbi:aminoglycoside phosphotransferase [Clostridia bacterium]|nr:aminoglycoside phosphotransferase [Clostridia bacterium]